MSEQLDADYFVCGAGAMGMAFVDSLLKETKATVVLVDRNAQPGGHWNHAYPFVHLHQPSKNYGVNSRKLERSSNPLELASRNEILAYYESVLEALISSGQVQYFPMCSCDDLASRHFFSLVEPSRSFKVSDRARIVDATYMNVVVPSLSDPQSSGRYQVDVGVSLVPLNKLTLLNLAFERYVVIGAGKTGMDAVLWLLNNKVVPEHIYWIMPRDSWIISREIFGTEFFDNHDLLKLISGIQNAVTVQDFYCAQEQVGFAHRIDAAIVPTQYKCATASDYELQQLKSIKNIVRLGRVEKVQQDKVVLSKGSLPTGGNTLYVDCSADGLATRPAKPVFAGDLVTLQSVSMCQQVFSASFIGYVEGRGGSDVDKNRLCVPVPHPDTPEDGVKAQLQSALNYKVWVKDPKVKAWLKGARLFGLTRPEKLMSFRQRLMMLLRNLPNLQKLLAADKEQLASLQRLSKL